MILSYLFRKQNCWPGPGLHRYATAWSGRIYMGSVMDENGCRAMAYTNDLPYGDSEVRGRQAESRIRSARLERPWG